MSVPGLDFTAIDFETANQNAASVCAVGLIKVRDGVVVEQGSSLVKNPDGGSFNPFNIRIHGIRPADVVDAPTWTELWPDLRSFVDGDVLLAHNAAFDRGVWAAACRVTGIVEAVPPFYCTLRLARRVLCLPSNRLPLVAQALDVPAFKHHDATADALACAQIGIELARRQGYSCVQDFDTQVGARSKARASRNVPESRNR